MIHVKLKSTFYNRPWTTNYSSAGALFGVIDVYQQQVKADRFIKHFIKCMN